MIRERALTFLLAVALWALSASLVARDAGTPED